MEEAISVFIVRAGFALAGLAVAIWALIIAYRRVDIPNQVLSEHGKLKADVKSLQLQVEQALGAFEDRYNAMVKRQAAYQAGPRGPTGGRVDPEEAPAQTVTTAPAPGGNGGAPEPNQRDLRAAIRGVRQSKAG